MCRVRVVPSEAEGAPPAGTPVEIEIRDVTEADAASVTVAAATGTTDETIEVDVPDEVVADPRRVITVHARVAASGEPRVAPGDWITMRSFPVAPPVEGEAAGTTEVQVQPVR
jgi:hypothetical protein